MPSGSRLAALCLLVLASPLAAQMVDFSGQPGVSLAPAAAQPPAVLPSSSRAEPRPAWDDDAYGSTTVPMDSWVYPALERLGALGFVPSQQLAIRPWTRQECRRQLREAHDLLYGFSSLDENFSRTGKAEAERMLPQLERELQEPEAGSYVALESVYAREGNIAGTALTDGFHFGQTWWNDMGRPLARGNSTLAGYALRAHSGRFFFYNRQEMQNGAGLPPVSPQLAAFINSIDNAPFNSFPPGVNYTRPAASAFVRQRPLELYAGVAFAGANLSFGKQTLHWGPTVMGPWSFSSNAEPTYNLRLLYTRPHPIPFLNALGTYRIDLVIGKLSGQRYPARPYFNGQKLEVSLGSYLEMSLTRWSLLWGVGHPMTLHSLKENLFSANSTGGTDYGARDDPGDRKGGFDFRLHVPGLKHLVTVYADGYSDDEVNPLQAPRRVAWQPGIYVAQLPGAPHMDLRFEMSSSEELSQDEGGSRFFINNQYRDGNTNKGFPLGSAVGRDGRAFEGRLGYWHSPRTRVEVGYRQSKISSLYQPNGGTISDGFSTVSYTLARDWTINAFGQYERFLVPSLTPGRQSNGSARIQITWTPKDRVLTR